MKVIERNLMHHSGSRYNLIKVKGVFSEQFIFALQHSSVTDSEVAWWFIDQRSAHRELSGKSHESTS